MRPHITCYQVDMHLLTSMYSRLTLSTAPPLYNRYYYDLAPLWFTSDILFISLGLAWDN